MSEFECSKGHIPAPSTIRKGRCPCGAKIIRMDGKTSRQLAYEERELGWTEKGFWPQEDQVEEE
jgi:hypothetical protein